MAVCHVCNKGNAADMRFCRWCGTVMRTGIDASQFPSQTHLHHGRYTLGKLLGQGGMGRVYKAQDRSMEGKIVAIKEMRQNGLTAQELQHARAAFIQESALLGNLDHPALPHVHQQFEEDGQYYLVMDFIEGVTLEEYWETYKRREKPIPIERVLDIGIQLCTVLDYLHTQEPPIVFRDLKPANVMLDPQGRVYLIDFGIARLFKTDQVQDTVALGSPGYAPPEQYRRATSLRSDIYSLGAVLHQLLTGNDPTFGLLHFKAFALNMPALEKLVMRMVERDAQQRPASIKDVEKALRWIAENPQRHAVDSIVDEETAPSSTTP